MLWDGECAPWNLACESAKNVRIDKRDKFIAFNSLQLSASRRRGNGGKGICSALAGALVVVLPLL